jgi:hypothetical protein
MLLPSYSVYESFEHLALFLSGSPTPSVPSYLKRWSSLPFPPTLPIPMILPSSIPSSQRSSSESSLRSSCPTKPTKVRCTGIYKISSCLPLPRVRHRTLRVLINSLQLQLLRRLTPRCRPTEMFPNRPSHRLPFRQDIPTHSLHRLKTHMRPRLPRRARSQSMHFGDILSIETISRLETSQTRRRMAGRPFPRLTILTKSGIQEILRLSRLSLARNEAQPGFRQPLLCRGYPSPSLSNSRPVNHKQQDTIRDP